MGAVGGGGGARRPILVVEDDEDLVSCLRMLLEEEGYPVVVASDGDAALDAAANADPALVLIDLHLPGPLSGQDLVNALRARLDPAVRLVLLTGDDDVPRRASELGVDDFLAKPFELDALLEMVDHLARH